MDLRTDFEHILGLIEDLENATLGSRVKRRIANAFDQATGKAMVLGWYAKTDPEAITDDGAVRNTLMRHAERGARTYVE